MSKKRSGSGNSAPLTCSKCGMKAVSTPNTNHRRCGGREIIMNKIIYTVLFCVGCSTSSLDKPDATISSGVSYDWVSAAPPAPWQGPPNPTWTDNGMFISSGSEVSTPHFTRVAPYNMSEHFNWVEQ